MDFKEEILSKRIVADNPWWSTGEIPHYSTCLRRGYFTYFYKKVRQTDLNRAVVLMGPRRVGKTVMMYQAIQQLMADGVDPKEIVYFSLDTPIFTNMPLEYLLDKAKELVETEAVRYVFYDEIQYLKDWEVHLKSLVDSYRHIRFVGSGSAAAALKRKSMESGAGRFTDFFLPPLTFAEYVDLKGVDHALSEIELDYFGDDPAYTTDDIEGLNAHFMDYISFGGFPEIALSDKEVIQKDIVIQKEITDRVIMKDLPGLFGIDNVLELQQFFNVLAFRTSEIMTYHNIAQDTDMDIKTIKKYLTYLEAAFLIRILHRTDVTAKRFKNVTQFKVHLSNPSLFTGLFGGLEESHERFPHLVETTLFTQQSHYVNGHLRYARWKSGGEVDLTLLDNRFSSVLWATEVKWSDRVKAPNLKYFMKKNGLKKALLTSKTIFEDQDDLLVMPCCIYAYTLGKQAIARL